MATKKRSTKRAPVSKARAAAKKKPATKVAATAKPKAKARAAPVRHDERFPGESPAYRKARNQLLEAEIGLRRQTEAVAALRRKLPPGGEVPQDYVFEEGAADLSDDGGARQVRLSELFVHPDASLVLYSFMYGPNMAKPCPMCTAMLDSLNGTAPHATQRINLAVVASSPLPRIRAFARERGWTNLRLLSSAGTSFNRDYRGEGEDGSQQPALNVFARHGGRTHHMFNTELLFVTSERGENGRHVDPIWPLWNLFDMTPDGRGGNWYPKLSYAT
jgi:predicted dithiol-disulfide oxidoreductase (DUF899 family)